MKKMFLLFLLHFCFFATAQIDTINKKKLIFIELGGAAGYGSINYEILFKKINKIKLSTRLGLSSYRLKDFENVFNPDIIVPISINTYYGNNHHIDFSFGQVFTSTVHADRIDYKPKRINNISTSLSIGYRFQKEVSGFMCKIAYSPLLQNNNKFRHWISLAFGRLFK